MYYCISISMNNAFEQTYYYGVDNSPFSSESITYYSPIPNRHMNMCVMQCQSALSRV